MTIDRTSTGYRGVINGAPFTVVVQKGEIKVDWKAGFYLNTGEHRQIVREVKKREAEPLLNNQRDTKAAKTGTPIAH